MRMSDWQPAAYKGYQWIVADPDLLGGKLALRGTRISVSPILECLANGMNRDEINEAYSQALPPDALSEVLQVASELTESFHVVLINLAQQPTISNEANLMPPVAFCDSNPIWVGPPSSPDSLNVNDTRSRPGIWSAKFVSC
jgi:uncharacterized protein (DUF433 family)